MKLPTSTLPGVVAVRDYCCANGLSVAAAATRCRQVASPRRGTASRDVRQLVPAAVIEPRDIVFEADAVSALFEILGIMTDQLMEGNMVSRWDAEAIVDLQMRLSGLAEGESVRMGIDDAALLLDGMAFTEVMSVDFPFFEMVQWTSDFVTAELRAHWSEELWLAYVGSTNT